MPKSPATTVRLEVRISPDLHIMLKRAAKLQDRTIKDFVISAVQDAAQQVIEQANVLKLSIADQERFANALLSTPHPNEALKRAFSRRTKLVMTE